MGSSLNHFYEMIHGWFDFQDIYSEAIERSPLEGAVFVEVGSWLGRSTAFMAVEIANSGKKIKFCAVDTWTGFEATEEMLGVAASLGKPMKEAFLENMAPIIDAVTPFEMTSVEAASQFENGSVDFVFIDADHRYEAVVQDIQAWLPKLKSGGFIAGHDYSGGGNLGVSRAVRVREPVGSTRRVQSWEFQRS